MSPPSIPPSGRSQPLADLFGERSAHPLDLFFRPRSVAVIGASERAGAVGRTVLWNLVRSPFGGTVFPVNARRSNVLGIKSYRSVAAVPEPVELAVVVTPAASVPGVMAECAAAGVRGAIVISAGFREAGAEGERLEAEVVGIARAAGMRLIGPNCLGVMCTVSGLNATFAGGMARPGTVAFVSQSGALQTAILDWSLEEKVGFSSFVSLGSMGDVGWGDLIDYFGDDQHTRSILIYMESIGDARAFLSAAREVALRKPIIVIKGGRTEAGAVAASAHTGTASGDDAVLTAAFRRAGVLRVDSIADLFFMADTLAKQPRPAGRRLSILTNAGGPGVLAVDALVRGGGELAVLAPETEAALGAALPGAFPHVNPIDLLGDADPERYAKALEIAAGDDGSDGMLVILTPQDQSQPTLTAERLKGYASKFRGKPLLCSWMGGAELAPGRHLLADAGVACFSYPDTAARIFNYMWRYSYNLRGLYETPALADPATVGRERVAQVLGAARAAGRAVLSAEECQVVMGAYGIEVAPAVGAGEPTPEGFLLAVDSVLDPQFGPVVRFRAGGFLGDVLDERSLALPPLNTTLARRMMEQTRFHAVLRGVRGQPAVDLAGLEKLIVRFSELISDHRAIREAALDPVFAAAGGVVVRGARVLLHGREVRDEALPTTAIRPYPARYIGSETLKSGEVVVVRPIRPEDEPRIAAFHRTLSEQSVYMRYAGVIKLDQRVSHERLARLCFIDYDREMALVVERAAPPPAAGAAPGEPGPPELVAVARLRRLLRENDAEFALLVSDSLQGQGLGRHLLERLIAVGRDWGLDRIVAEILRDNEAMRRVARSLGFVFEAGAGTGAVLDLRAPR